MPSFKVLRALKNLLGLWFFLLNLLIVNDLSGQDCNDVAFQINGSPFCTGDVLELSVSSVNMEVFSAFWFSDIFPSYELIGPEHAVVIENFYGFNGPVGIYVEVFFDDDYYTICSEFLEIEVYDQINENYIDYDPFSCELCIATYSPDTDFFLAQSQNEFTPIDNCISLAGLQEDFFDVVMINSGAPNGACATSTLTLENECNFNEGACSGLDIALNQSIFCAGDEIVIQFEGDLNNLANAGLYSSSIEFGNQNFDGQQLIVELLTDGFQCLNGSYEIQVVTTCQNGQDFFSAPTSIEIYTSLNPASLILDEFNCGVFFSNYYYNDCGFYEGIYEINPISGFSSWNGFFGEIDAPTTGEYEYSIEFVNILAPSDMECASQVITGNAFCEVCTEPLIEMSSDVACPGDTIVFTVFSPMGNLDLVLPDGQVISKFIVEEVELIPWVVQSSFQGCVSTQAIEVFFNCTNANVASDLLLDITILERAEDQHFLVYEDCIVCVGSTCSDDEYIVDWEYPSGLGIVENVDCINFTQLLVAPVNISASVTDARDTNNCLPARILRDEFTCSGCSPMYAEFPDSLSICPDDLIDLSADFQGVPASNYVIEWLLDDNVIDQNASLFQAFEILECIESHELVLRTACTATGNIVSLDTIALTFYNQLGASLVSTDCYVELIPVCDEVDVFWSEGAESQDGTVFIPDENTSGSVSFFLVSTAEVFSCNQAIFEIEYECTDTGIEDLEHDWFDILVNISRGQIEISSEKEIERLRLLNLAGKEIALDCSETSEWTTCRFNNLPSGTYLVEAMARDGSHRTKKVQL